MSIFAGMPADQLRTALSAAQLALIELQSGRAYTSLSYAQGDGSKSVTQRVTSVAECTALIAQLQSALGIRGARRPMRIIY